MLKQMKPKRMSDRVFEQLKGLIFGGHLKHGERLMDLLEVRLGLACNAVALAARRASEEDIREIEKSVEQMSAAMSAGGCNKPCGYLHEFPVDFFQLDGSFTHNILRPVTLFNVMNQAISAQANACETNGQNNPVTGNTKNHLFLHPGKVRAQWDRNRFTSPYGLGAVVGKVF